MFKTLHRKLAFLNALVLISFLLIFSYSIVVISSIQQSNSSKIVLQDRANQIIEKSLLNNRFNSLDYDSIFIDDRYLNNRFTDRKSINYMLWYDDFKQIKSSLTTVDQELINTLYLEAENSYKSMQDTYVKSIKIGDNSYRVYTSYYQLLNGQIGIIQVFQNKNLDDYTLNTLFFTFIKIGSVSIVILILISSFLAKKSLKPVKQAYERQKQFIADASHELRTPLTVMKTSLELLSMKEDETIRENEKWFNNVMTETDTMTKLVQNLLVLAQVDNKQVNVKLEQMNFSKILTVVCGRMNLLMHEKNIKFICAISEDVFILGDKNTLEQLIIILIDNAIKYTHDDGEIMVSFTSTFDKVILSIKDTGIGINEEDKKKIFDRFYRVDKVRSREQGGVGLGLSIAKWIVDRHNGIIYINSELDLGSEFIIEFQKKT